MGGPRRLARICVCGSVRFRPEKICAVTDSVSEQQRSVRSISSAAAVDGRSENATLYSPVVLMYFY